MTTSTPSFKWLITGYALVLAVIVWMIFMIWPTTNITPPVVRTVSCFSGNKLWFSVRAKDDVKVNQGAFMFTNFDTDRQVIVSGNCVVEYL